MVRWIAFDDETAEAVVSRFRRGAAEIHPGNTAIDSALTAGQPSLIVLPSDTPGRVLLAHIDPKVEFPEPPSLVAEMGAQKASKSEKSNGGSKNKKWWQRRTA
jgi:hypothetical protein